MKINGIPPEGLRLSATCRSLCRGSRNQTSQGQNG